MKKFASIVSVLAVVLFAVACNAEGQVAKKTSLDNFDEQLSYAVGMDMGNSLKSIPANLDMGIVFQAIQTVMAGDSSKILLNDSALSQIKKDFSAKMFARQDSVRKAATAKNLEEGKAFLEANKAKEGVKVTASGLQYKVLTEGQGEMPGDSATVKVHYTGKLLDGTKFDSSYDRNNPATFPVYGVIKGWQEALKLMKAGSKYELWIPSELAYGERGGGAKIAPNATLHFEVELLEIVKTDAAAK